MIMFLQVPHHIDIHMKPTKLQAITEREKKKLLGDFNAKKKWVCINNINYCHNFNIQHTLNFRKNLSRLEWAGIPEQEDQDVSDYQAKSWQCDLWGSISSFATAWLCDFREYGT